VPHDLLGVWLLCVALLVLSHALGEYAGKRDGCPATHEPAACTIVRLVKAKEAIVRQAICLCGPAVRHVEIVTSNTKAVQESFTVRAYLSFKFHMWSTAISGIAVLLLIRPLLSWGISKAFSRSEETQEVMYRTSAACHSALDRVVESAMRAREGSVLFGVLVRVARSVQLRIEDFIEDRVIAPEIQERIDGLSGPGHSAQSTTTN